ncbi:hypothetical protein CFP56_006452 [Quercus suber]|uniref:Uncharacterized protein n=1 Tax=Quercus suber TaxID=58331 RepID=A0AAW0L826_QUESU
MAFEIVRLVRSTVPFSVHRSPSLPRFAVERMAPKVAGLTARKNKKGLRSAATSGDYECLPIHKPPTPISKPPTLPPKVEKPPVYKPPTPVQAPPKVEKPPTSLLPKVETPAPPKHLPSPPYGHYPGHPPVEKGQDPHKTPCKILPPPTPYKKPPSSA